MSRAKGDRIEQQVELYLQQQGLQPVTRNYNTPGGEIDLIMLDRNTLVFVEVRFRRSNRFGSAAESIDYPKQQRIINTAAHFLQHHPKHHNRSCRFDVAACQPDNSGDSLQIQWLSNAFDAS